MNKKRGARCATFPPLVNLLVCILAIMLLFPAQGLASFSNLPTNSLVGLQPTIRILTLNVMQFTEKESRDSRFNNIAEYVNSHPPVHALALQELSAGTLDGADTVISLSSKLGGNYGYYTESSHRSEVFFVWTEFKVGVMSRYTMDYHTATAVLPPGEYLPEDPYTEFSGRANVVMCVMDIPGFGKVNLYSTHIYPGSIEERRTQAANLMNFVNQVDQAHPARATIVAGDMNFPDTEAYQEIYNIFISHGFADSYREFNPDDPGYTYGVSTNKFYNSGTPRRIDYIFVRGNYIQTSSSKVVFDGVNGEYVSDHFGVLTEITAISPLPSILPLLDE